MKKKVLAIVLTTVLVLTLGLVMAVPAGAQPVCVETLYLSDTLGKADGYSKLFEVVLDEASVPPAANLIPLPNVGWGPGIIPMEHADAIACTPDGTKIYCMQEQNFQSGPLVKPCIGYYDLTDNSWHGPWYVDLSGISGLNFQCIDRLAFASDGTLYFELNSGTTNALARITDVTTLPIVATVMGKVKDGTTALDIQGADIAFDSGNTCYLWHKKAVPEGVYYFPQPTTPGDISATYLGPGTDIADDYKVTGMAIRGCGTGGYPLLISDKTDPQGMIHEVDVATGDMGNTYLMYEAGSPFDHGNGDMTVGELAVEEELSIEVEKDYRYTDVCFEKDNDGDGLFNEDPVDLIDNDGDGLIDEDPVDCPLGTYLGDRLPMDTDGYYHLEAVIHPKNNKVRSYNPGQYYAVSTVNVLSDVDTLTILEDWSACGCDLDSPISVLNPKKGGGRVVIVQVGGEINGVPVPDPLAAYQIYDATSDAIEIDGCTATATLENVAAGTTIYMYVKFGPGLKGADWATYNGQPCINYNRASIVEVPTLPEDWIEATANLIVVPKD